MGITDVAEFDRRLAHAYGKLLWHVPEQARTGKLLDIGCGMGAGIVAALKHGACFAVGIDRDLREFGHHFSPQEFAGLCQRHGVSDSRALLLAADVFDIDFEAAGFDCVLMLDAIEHVPDPGRFVSLAYACLKEGGHFLVDTCPLYFSPVGHHLWQWFPEGSDPWAHLRPDFHSRAAAMGIDEWSMARFRELNRVTHDALREAFLKAGFTIADEVRSAPTPERRKAFEHVRASLDLAGIREEWLFEDWILLAGRK